MFQMADYLQRKVSIMKRLFILFIISLTVFNASPVGSVENEKTIIQLPEKFVVPDKSVEAIRLGDIALDIQAPTPQTKQALEQLEVMDAPKPGEQSRLPNNYIIRSIRHAGHDFYNLLFEGPRVVQIYGPGKLITVQDMIKKIKEYIQKETAWTDEELVLRIISTPTKDCWLPDKTLEMVVEQNTPSIYGTSRFEIQFYVDNILTEEASFVVSAERKRKIYVAKRSVQRGEVLTEEDFRERIVLIDDEFDDHQFVENKEELIGKKTRVTLRKNKPISWNNLENNYILKRGDLVNLIVRNGGLVLQTSATVQGRAALGDVVIVKMQQTNQLVKAKVINRQLVIYVSS